LILEDISPPAEGVASEEERFYTREVLYLFNQNKREVMIIESAIFELPGLESEKSSGEGVFSHNGG